MKCTKNIETCGKFNKELKMCESESTIGECKYIRQLYTNARKQLLDYYCSKTNQKDVDLEFLKLLGNFEVSIIILDLKNI